MATKVRNVVILVSIGITCWVVAGVIAIANNAEAKIIWTCVVGAILGLIAIRYTIRRNRRTGI